MEEDIKYFYLVKTNPHQRGEYGGTDYKHTIVATNKVIDIENLRIMLHEMLDIPYTVLYQWLWEDSTEKDWTFNMRIEEIAVDKINTKKISEFFYLKLKNYPQEMPDTGAEVEHLSATEDLNKMVFKKLEEAKLEKQREEQEELLSSIKYALKSIDKETLLRLIIEQSEEKN